MTYVDGFLLVVPEENMTAYKKLATKAGKIWLEHGALDYKECVAEDVDGDFGRPFPKIVKPKSGEVIVFSYIVYKSKSDRNKINKKVMSDPRLEGMDKACPFDVKRMSYGGFKTLVEF